jgi:hypothetical protein
VGERSKYSGIIDLTPGIRSLQIHFDSIELDQIELLHKLQQAENELPDIHNMQVPSHRVFAFGLGRFTERNSRLNVIRKLCVQMRLGALTMLNLFVVSMV